MLNDRVVVNGTASRSVAPDGATVDVKVKEVDADPGAAFERFVPRMNEVVARLSALVGGDGQVTTRDVEVQRDYELEQEETGPVCGFGQRRGRVPARPRGRGDLAVDGARGS